MIKIINQNNSKYSLVGLEDHYILSTYLNDLLYGGLDSLARDIHQILHPEYDVTLLRKDGKLYFGNEIIVIVPLDLQKNLISLYDELDDKSEKQVYDKIFILDLMKRLFDALFMIETDRMNEEEASSQFLNSVEFRQYGVDEFNLQFQ